MSEVEFRGYEPGDEHAILDTFNRTFREVCGEGYVDRTLETWRWQYLDNPHGMRIMLGIADDGRIACQYAGVPMRVWSTTEGGRVLSFFHAVDSMVHPDFRQGLRKRGLFLEIAERFFERYGGSDDHLGFGYPVRPAWRIGERFLGYRLVQSVDFLRRRTGGPLDDYGLELSCVERFSGDATRLFDSLRAKHDCVTEKTTTYLNWRYADCPHADYKLLWATRGGVPRGLAVVRTEGGLAPESATIGDLLFDPDDGDTLRALVGLADRLAAEAGCDYLMTVQNPNLAAAQVLGSIGFDPEPSSKWLERKLGSRDWTSGLTQEWLAQHWCYQLGDSDLF